MDGAGWKAPDTACSLPMSDPCSFHQFCCRAINAVAPCADRPLKSWPGRPVGQQDGSMPISCVATAPVATRRPVCASLRQVGPRGSNRPDFRGRPDGDTRFDDCNSYALDDGQFLACFAESCKANSGFRHEPTTLLQHYRAALSGAARGSDRVSPGPVIEQFLRWQTRPPSAEIGAWVHNR